MAHFMTTTFSPSITSKKKEQSFRKGTVLDVIKTFKSLVKRQQNEEVRAIDRSGPYRLSDRIQ